MPLNASQVAKLATGDPIRKSDGKGLYFVVPESGEPFWALRYTVNGKRRHRVFRKEIDPVIGRMGVNDVSPLDIREVIRRVKISNRPTIANDVLMYAKQLFRHAIKLGLTYNNPAAAFTISDAGGIENSRDRALAPEEIAQTFQVFRENAVSFGWDNYWACCLILVLEVRKSELCEAL